MLSQEDAFDVIRTVRKYQDARHGVHKHDIPAWILIIRKQLHKAEEQWLGGFENDALERLGHVGACAVAALEHNGGSVR